MKKLLALAFVAMLATSAKADICIPADPDFDAGDCVANGGDPTGLSGPIGINGGPGGLGGPTDVPIDGGMSLLLASAGIMGARRVWSRRKAAK